MSHYTEQSRTTSRNGLEYQPVEPNQATFDTIAKIRADNAAIAAEQKRIGRRMTAMEQKTFLAERAEIAATLDEVKAEMLDSRMARFIVSYKNDAPYYPLCIEGTGAEHIAAGIFAAQITAHL